MKSTVSSKKSPLSREVISDWYTRDVLEGNEPKNVYQFSKNHGIKESEFYRFFNGFESIENYFFELLHEKTLETLGRSGQYEGYDAKEKLLSFYYTFFGNLAANRSFVLHILSEGRIENIRKLKGLHRKFTPYIRTLGIEKFDLKNKRLNQFQDKAMDEAAWMQLISILKFWYHDESADFEKTDIFIEKSVTAGFDLVNTKPLKSIADLGKFILKELNPVG